MKSAGEASMMGSPTLEAQHLRRRRGSAPCPLSRAIWPLARETVYRTAAQVPLIPSCYLQDRAAEGPAALLSCSLSSCALISSTSSDRPLASGGS